jgi:hypothetical protein
MTGTGTFADIIGAVTDMWGLLALALLLIGLLAIQLTKGANPNVRTATFLVIFAGFLGSLYMAFAGPAGEPGDAGAEPAAAASAPDPEAIAAQADAAAEYRESVDAAYGNAADEMNSVAARIAGEAPAEEPGAATAD